jgi:transposase-like protein
MNKIIKYDGKLQPEAKEKLLQDTADLSSLSLDEILRIGAQDMLKRAVLTEADLFCQKHRDKLTGDNRAGIVKNGTHSERIIQSSAGPISIKVPRINDRRDIPVDQKIKYQSIIIPPYIRKTGKIEDLIPILYLHGVSTNDMQEALKVLLGSDAKCSPATVNRLLTIWDKEHADWRSRDLSDKEFVYIWADGIYTTTRGGDKQCILVLIGALKDGSKELIGLDTGLRESKGAWKGFLLRLQEKNFKPGKLFVGDGALGFWAAVRELYPGFREQRCWVHKTANILDKLPKSLHSKAKSAIHEIWMAESKKDANKAFDRFLKTYAPKYPKAAECLEKDRVQLLTFYDFPAEHWIHIRTTNPIESTFATTRLRTKKTRGNFSSGKTEVMFYKFINNASKRWRRLNGPDFVLQVYEGQKFEDGVLRVA